MKFDAIETNVRAVMDPLPEGSRMDAYYFGFDATGVGAVDAILSAVAIAGKGAHNTADWYDDGGSYYCARPGLAPNTGDGQGSAATLIAATAVQSAERISALAADYMALLAEVQRPSEPRPLRVETYRSFRIVDEKSPVTGEPEFRWRVVHTSNGETMASGEGYVAQVDRDHAVEVLFPGVEIVEVDR